MTKKKPARSGRRQRRVQPPKLDNQLEYKVDFLPAVKVGKGPHDAAAIANELNRIEREKRVLRPDYVLEAAREPTNPLHRYFEWDDTAAAAQWRLRQARELIASVRVKITAAPERPPFRAFLHVAAPHQQQRYVSTERAMSDPDMRRIILNRAISELDSFKKRYAEVEELAGVFSEADKLAARASAKSA